ncbi:GNAT family N-acetyltransferase [Anaeromyxobacter sp. SG66]|uniref:GNAT family N-acetyltransferase n=1 Tax=Anaeromyxobacter sp. SG66 TaxID=2925410 RepID=UPI001F582D04|nr:hypothetical protein [Anaeromyxobacter sp. SG66]
MTSAWRFRYLQFREYARDHGLAAACRFALHRSEEAVPIEKDLSALKPVAAPPGPGLELFEIGPENVDRFALDHPEESRGARVKRYLERGYRTLVMTRGRKVIADYWYVGRRTARTRGIHPHLRWFGIDLGEDDVYMFDMHLAADERGGGMATYFMSRALHHLRAAGVRRAYGYYDAGNLPALWVHRLLGYRELPRVTIHKFLWLETAFPKVARVSGRPAGPDAAPALPARSPSSGVDTPQP